MLRTGRYSLHIAARLVSPIALVLLPLIVAACGGGNEQSGVDLQVAGPAALRTATSAPTLTPVPADPDPGSAPFALTGRLLILRGATFEILDLASRDTTVLTGPRSYSPAFFNRDQTRAALVLFPNYGVLDLPSQTITEVRNTASNPLGVTISPDGNWLLAVSGQFTQRLQVLSADGSVIHNVAASGSAQFGARWTPDSTLLWWTTDGAAERSLFDPQTGTSTPLDADDLPLEPQGVLAPDASRVATVPIAFRPTDPGAEPAACFDSYVAVLNPPFTLPREAAAGQTIWTAPGLVASSPQWLDSDRLLFVRLGTGDCGEVQGDPDRHLLLLDTSASQPNPQPIAGPLGNADDPNDRTQAFGRSVAHLYSPSPDGRFIAWISGGRAARETAVNITEVATGATTVLLQTSAASAPDLASFLEDQLFRQVVWLE